MYSPKVSYLLFILFVFFFQLKGQDSKVHLFVEYSPNMSVLTNSVISSTEYKPSHHFSIRASLDMGKRFGPTMALGYLNTGEMINSINGGSLGIQSAKTKYNYNYLILPVGAILKLGKWRLVPEIGAGINLSNRVSQVIEYSDGRKERNTSHERLLAGKFNRVTFPAMLSFGREAKVFGQTMFYGLNGYYSLNQVVTGVSRDNNYYGLGLRLSWKLSRKNE